MSSNQAVNNAYLTVEQCSRARLARDPRFDGLFFILVKSTGVFCRPICRVRLPQEKNVEYSFSAVDAIQRGYRPCLRCRPDSAPMSFAWLGVETSVKRACSLLVEYPCQSIEEISQRLGISARYLTKLFAEYLQVSPKQYRLYHQLLSAKRLLHQTQFTIEEIAQSVGFSGARQLQVHTKSKFNLTPKQIRQSNRQSISDSASKQIEMFLPYRPPYEWEALRDFLELRAIAGNEKITSNSVAKILSINDRAVPIMLIHKPDNSGFTLKFSTEHLSLLSSIYQAVHIMLDLHAAPLVIEQALKNSGLPSNDIMPGVRIPGVANRFEAACRAVLGQQVSIKAAITHLNRLHEHLSKDGAFPTALDVSQSSLPFLKMPERRKQALRDVASLLHNNPDASIDEWLEIKGIGSWTCEYVKMRTHASTDVYLATDLVIKQQVESLRTQGIQLDAPRSAPWQSYLTFTIWNRA
ncbi:DNA-3-methyladenine glycosylase 2 family protein [Agaribacter flavus]|uniref:DNA-3-methyladenine glycosylase 2 family protein n=1 Tax=Agaribacter flavus TaxID=1902781 RepID=A0ABV7FRI8_9ALTE